MTVDLECISVQFLINSTFKSGKNYRYAKNDEVKDKVSNLK